jgi:beta-lactamase regulating signal transducer with metallopeptidase domain
MHILVAIALKSLIIAGATLGLLELLKHRSAAERSWVAHIGLLALVTLALAPLVLPSWNVEAPSLLGRAAPADVVSHSAVPAASAAIEPVTHVAPIATVAPTPGISLSPAAAATAVYAVPAAILLLITLFALARLVALQARADVLVDPHWLSALARAQRRMGFKHGTALLTSDELASPISWGLMRPVILLNTRAVEASGEAEAIIAHELAHVARMDWVKLLLARVATALFWFNPLVWVLAREAHQLREEAADDSVLGADILDTDYAQLLVGVARHECPGLLLGAHGVAPSKGSLARRVARVLDGTQVRGPVARSFAVGVLAGAMLVAAPLAALTLSPGSPTVSKAQARRPNVSQPQAPYYPSDVRAATDLPHIIADGVSTSVQTAVAAVSPRANIDPAVETLAVGPTGASFRKVNGVTVATAQSGAAVTVFPPDPRGRRKIVAVAPNGATSISFVDANVDLPGFDDAPPRHQERAIQRAIEMKAVGVTPEYMGAMRAAVPSLRGLGAADFVALKAVGVTPDFARDMVGAIPEMGSDQLVQARGIGVTGGYVRALKAAGVEGDLDDFIQLRAVGVSPEFVVRARKAGVDVSDPGELVKLITVGHVTAARRVRPSARPIPPGGWRGNPPPEPPDGG